MRSTLRSATHAAPRRRLTVAAALVALATMFTALPVAAADPPYYQVKNIRAGSASSSPQGLTAAGNVLYFTANDGTGGRELWRSDASAVGTKRVKNIRPGSASSNPTGLTPMGNKVFFVANDGTTGRELWKTDGTTAGTKRVKDIRSGSKGSKPQELTVVGNTLFFTANDGKHGRELWKSDGTAAGTRLVKDYNKSAGSFYPWHAGQLTSFGGRLFFSPLQIFVGQYDAHEYAELWTSDGTAAGTKPFYGWYPDFQDLGSISWPQELTRVGQKLFFRAEDDELWRSDGTQMGTRDMGRVAPYELTNVDGTLFFRGSQAAVNSGLWKSNGTISGTKLVKEIDQPSQLTNVGGTLFFTSLEPNGWQTLNLSDGTAAGTYGWFSVNPAAGEFSNLTAVGDTLYYALGGHLFYDTGGWSRPITPYGDGMPSWKVANLARVGGLLYFSANDGNRGQELWVFVSGD